MSGTDNRPVRYVWTDEHKRYADYRQEPTNLWVFARWMPLDWRLPTKHDSGHAYSQPASSSETGRFPKGEGARLLGQYNAELGQTASNLHYETVDHSYFVRERRFFREGKVFAVILSENAGNTATSYNSSISEVRFPGHYVHTQARRFVVVRQRREFCFACPIFTYSKQATKKRGVRPEEHGIAYSSGRDATLLPGETGIVKPSVAIDMAPGEPSLHIASRIYYGIHHPVQYNVKVKYIGDVPERYLPTLIGNWAAEDNGETKQSADVTAGAEDEELPGIQEREENFGDEHAMPRNTQGRIPTSVAQNTPRDPYLYHPTNNIYGFDKQFSPHVYHPKFNPYGYHPEHNSNGFHPSSNPYTYHPDQNVYGYHRKYNPYGYHPTLNTTGHHPSSNPYSYHPVHNTIGYHPSENSYSYHPTHNPHAYHPQKGPFWWHPKFCAYGYHATENTAGYHPLHKPKNFHPEVNPFGHHPTHDKYEYHPTHNMYAYHKKHNPSGHHPKHNPYAWHPTLNQYAYHADNNRFGYHPTYYPNSYHPELRPDGVLYDNNGAPVDDSDDDEEEEEEEEEDEGPDLYSVA